MVAVPESRLNLTALPVLLAPNDPLTVTVSPRLAVEGLIVKDPKLAACDTSGARTTKPRRAIALAVFLSIVSPLSKA